MTTSGVIPLTEHRIIDYILSNLDNVAQKQGRNNLTPRKTHLNKIIFYVVEELELPITRSWYMFGPFINTAPEIDGQFLHVQNKAKNREIERYLTKLNRTIEVQFPELFNEVEELLLKYYHFLFINKWELTREIYNQDAPEKYKGLYLSSLDFRMLSERIIESTQQQPLFFDFALEYSTMVTRFHETASIFAENDLLISCLYNYSELMEKMVIKLDSLERTNLVLWHDIYQDIFNYFNFNVWKMPSSIISSETIIGPERDKFHEIMLSNLSLIPKEINPKYNEYMNDVIERNLVPSPEELLKFQDNLFGENDDISDGFRNLVMNYLEKGNKHE